MSNALELYEAADLFGIEELSKKLREYIDSIAKSISTILERRFMYGWSTQIKDGEVEGETAVVVAPKRKSKKKESHACSKAKEKEGVVKAQVEVVQEYIKTLLSEEFLKGVEFFV
ncbi:hypothetical protein HDV05_007417 [Chytridiales sp. JEL 0842]|nr:hypothetical protein HDV05_007417 [Chytridiales sp. JEL 0842]